MIKDWKVFRDMALEHAKTGVIPVYGEFCIELEEVVVECIWLAQKSGHKKVTLLINSNGGINDCFTSIWAAMIQSGIEFTGLVTARARSNGFRLLQVCKFRKALSNADVMFHWGQYRLDNGEIAAIIAGQDWILERVRNGRMTMLQEVNARTGIPVSDLTQYALYERNFSAEDALKIGFIDEIVKDSPVPTSKLDAQLTSRPVV